MVHANHTLSKWLALQASSADEAPSAADVKGAGGTKDAGVKKNWLEEMADSVKRMLGNLPEALSPMVRSESSIEDPLWRCIDREVQVGRKLLEKVRGDLQMLSEICEGKTKSTNELRTLATNL